MPSSCSTHCSLIKTVTLYLLAACLARVRYINIFLVLSRCIRPSGILLDNNVQACRVTFVVIIRRRGRCSDVHRAVQCGFSTRISRKRNADYLINLLNPIRFREERLSRKVDGFDSCFDILHPADVYSRSKIHGELDSLSDSVSRKWGRGDFSTNITIVDTHRNDVRSTRRVGYLYRGEFLVSRWL